MRKLQPILNDDVDSGVYRFTSRAAPESILAELEEEGWSGFHIDGGAVIDKASFLARGAQAMDFPDYFGHNWDAFEESVNDLEWAPASGYVLLIDDVAEFAENRPDEWRQALEILEEAAARWQEAGTPFYVLLRGARRSASEVPWL